MRAFAVASLLFLVVASAGCFGMFEAHVPSPFLTGGWEQTDSGGGGSWLGEGARWSHVSYEVDPPRGTFDSGPYPGYLTVLSIDAVMPLDNQEVSGNLDEQVQRDAEEQNVQLDQGSRKSGERNLASGVKTLWFTYRGEAEGGGLFRSGNEVRVVGEVWPDERSRITVVTVGLSQVEGGFATTHTDHTNWDRIIADPDGAIESRAEGSQGLIYNVRSHDS